MKHIAVFFTCALMSFPFYANASVGVLAESTFDAGTDGWSALGTSGSTGSWAMTSGPFSVSYIGGAISMTDPDNEWTYFSAPSKFLGDMSAAFGGQLQFESRVLSAPGGSYANEAEVMLRGGGMTLVYDATSTLTSLPTSFDISLTSGNWRVNDTFSGAAATDADLQTVLGDLTALWINAEYFTPVVETIALDNVRLITAVPEPQTYGMMLAGLALVGWAARRAKSS